MGEFGVRRFRNLGVTVSFCVSSLSGWMVDVGD